jgi:hypothetical protein
MNIKNSDKIEQQYLESLTEHSHLTIVANERNNEKAPKVAYRTKVVQGQLLINGAFSDSIECPLYTCLTSYKYVLVQIENEDIC